MLPSTKRNLVLGVFLVIVTLVVLYSYCNGNSVCYTFPLFSGLERDRLVKPEVVVTSVIVQTKRPFHIGEISGKPKGKQDESSAKHSELHRSQYQHIDEKKKTDFTEEVEKLYFDHNTTSPKTYLFNQGDKKDNITRAKETFEAEKHLLPPSDIIGKVAEEILRRANVSEEEANRELIRVEKVDEIVDKEKRKQEHALLKKVKESRGAGGKNSEKKLVRVERVDLTDDEDEDENIPKKQVHEPEKQVRESDSYERAKSNNASFDGAAKKSSRMELGMDSKSEDSESAHARRFGISFAANNTLKNNSSVVKREDKSRNSTSSNAMMNEPTSTLPPFFANFLNVTAKEREMDNLLHNFTNNSKPLDGPEPSISHQGNETEERKTTMAENIETLTAHAEKVNTREKRNPSETSLLDTLVAKLLNVTSDKETSQGAHNKSKPLDKSFNLSTILEKITEGSQKPLVNKHTETSVPDSTALLVKFLKEGSRYRLRTPHNVTAARADNGKGRIATTKIGNGKTGPQSSVNLKKTLLELANHIDLTRHDNHSETTIDQENKADLVMLKLLLNQSALQDLTSFNLSRVLKEITGNSLKISLTALQPVKVKRDNEEEDLGPSRAQSDVEIFRPIPDKLETSTPQPVLSTERKPSSSFKGDKELFSAHDSLNTTSVGMGSRKYHASFSSGSGSGDPGNVESERDSEKGTKRRYVQKGRSKRGTNGILKFEKIGCEELDPKVLLYNRIFKTGSSTTESVITNSSSAMNYDYKIGTTEDWYDKGRSGPYPGLIIRKANKKLVKHPRMAFVAHFYFRSNLNLPQAHTYINQVRHPIRRLVSHYHYMRSMNRPKNRIKEFIASRERKESLEQCFRRQHKGCKNNVMTRFFCGRHFYCRRGNWRALQKAKHNIKRYYAAVGLLEHYEVYLQILYKRLPKFFPKVSNHDIGKFKYNPIYSFEDVPEDLIGEITRANWADVKLYSFVKKRFWKQAKICGINKLY